MSLTILKQSALPLLKRKRVTFEYAHQREATPKKAIIKEEAAKALKVAPELLSVRHIYTHYGNKVSKIIVHVYEDATHLARLEPPKGKKAGAKETPKK